MKKDKYFGLSRRIAGWKLDTRLENWLSYHADTSEFWKRLYVMYYRLLDRQYYKAGVPKIKNAITAYSDKLGRYNEKYIICDMVYCLHRFGISFTDYCIYDFVDKSTVCRNSFVSDKLRHYYSELVNAPEAFDLLNDKYACYLAYRPYYKRRVLGLYKDEDRQLFIDFVCGQRSFIFKPLSGNCGNGVMFVTLADAGEAGSFFDEHISKGGFVVEEPIHQGHELALLHPESINTCRVSTFVVKGHVYINAVTLRIGVGRSIVDNAGAGGIFASVDFENGFVQSDARNYIGKHYNLHPDTGVQIVGYRLPQWDSAMSMIREIAVCQKWYDIGCLGYSV